MPAVLRETPGNLCSPIVKCTFSFYTGQRRFYHYANDCSFRMQRREHYRRNKSKTRRRETSQRKERPAAAASKIYSFVPQFSNLSLPENRTRVGMRLRKVNHTQTQTEHERRTRVQFLQANKQTYTPHTHTHTLAYQQSNNKI